MPSRVRPRPAPPTVLAPCRTTLTLTARWTHRVDPKGGPVLITVD
ncbi:hypothetical protein [Streptomyces spiralis]